MRKISTKDILQICLVGIGLTSITALIYLAGPLINATSQRVAW